MGGYEVDPVRLAGDGKNLAEKGDALAAAVQALQSALSSSGQMCGDDAAGKAFALSYRQGGQALFSAAEAAVNACRKVGYGVEVSASNYAHSEAASTVGGAEPSVPPPGEPPKFSGPTMPNPFGPAVGEPMLWAVVRQFVGSPWPDGNPATLRAAAAAWRTFGSAVAGVTEAVGTCSADLCGHDIPELANISGAVTKLSSGVGGFGKQCESIASSLDSFAGEVESSQNAIRDLLHKLSPWGMAEEVVGIFTGHNPIDEIKKIANDIKEILHTLSREADGASTLFQDAMTELDSLTTEFENWTRKEFTQYLGNDVGNFVADVTTFQLDVGEGGVKSVIGTVGSLGDLVTHPKDLGKLALEANPITAVPMLATELARDPKGFIDQRLDMVKGLVDAKDWTGDHPGRGVGYVGGTIAQFLIPGAGEAKAATEAAKGADEAAQAARAESSVARAGEGALGVGAESGIAAKGSSIARDLNSIDLKGSEVVAPARPPEPGPSVRPAEPAPTPGGASGGAGAGRPPVDAPPAPHAGGPSGGGVREPAPLPAAEHSAPASAPPGGGVHEPAPVGSAAHPAPSAQAPHSAAPSTPAPDSYAPQPTLAGVHAPEAAPMSPAHEPIPDAHPGGSHPPEPPPGDPGGQGGGDGHGGGGGGGGGGHGGSGDGRSDASGHSGNGNGTDSHDGSGSSSHENFGDRQDPVHSDEASGDGWERLPDEPRDPHYGEPLSEHWEYPDNPADPSRINADVRNLMKDPDAPFGRDPEGHAFTQPQYEERFNKLGPNGERWYNFASDDGALSGTKVAFTDLEQYKKFYGAQFDRIGDEDGRYLAVMEDGKSAPWEQRSLNADSLSKPLHAYAIDRLPEGWTIEVSEIEPAVGQPGGALQVRIFDEMGKARTVEELTMDAVGVLRVLR